MKFNLKLFVLVVVLAGFRDVCGAEDEGENKDYDGFIVEGFMENENEELKTAMGGNRVIKAVYKTELDGEEVSLIDNGLKNKLSSILVWDGKNVENVKDKTCLVLYNNLGYNMPGKGEYTVYFIFQADNVESTKNMFFGCSRLISADLRFFDTLNVKDMSNMFYFCSSLNKLDLSNFKTEKVTNMSGMFYCCSSLTELNLRNFSFLNVVSKDDMFSGCSSLKNLTVKSGQVIVKSKCMGCCQHVYIKKDDVQALRSCNVTFV